VANRTALELLDTEQRTARLPLNDGTTDVAGSNNHEVL
jgi:hypothetical protein